MSKAKAQGTNWETRVKGRIKAAGFEARRLAEGGSYDEGDVEFFDAEGHRYVIECKATANLNVTKALHKAKRKTPTAIVALAWKRLTRKGDNMRRSPDGEPDVVVLDWTTFMWLVMGKP